MIFIADLACVMAAEITSSNTPTQLLDEEHINYQTLIKEIKEVKEKVADLEKLQIEAKRGNILMIICLDIRPFNGTGFGTDLQTGKF